MSSAYNSVPQPGDNHISRGYGNQVDSSPLAQSAANHVHDEDYDLSRPNSTVIDGTGPQRSVSTTSTAVAGGVSRSNTLRKKGSVRRTGSLKRSSSKRSLNAGSIKGFGGIDANSSDYNNVFFTPIPTTGSPTDILADRFQAWRQLLKSLITYFREIQNSYDVRAKAIHKVQNTLANLSHPGVFSRDGGLSEATRLLEEYHKRSSAEANKSKEIEDDVIGALSGLRSDLGQKIKEIKGLSGDFKNSVEKEKDATRKEVERLQDALRHTDLDSGSATGKNDPYVIRLGVDRAIEKQIDEENYLHRAYLNLESSGRELESIVVGEIQKAYNALAGILKREGDDAYNTVELLRTGPVSMPKDQEWYEFVTQNEHFVDPSVPLRRIEDIDYPGKHHPAATEIRAGMLERKSKYLKSYTPGWYVLSPTHLHEFKSADKIYSQPPVMSLSLFDQKLGSHSERTSSSHKFMLKGKQSGGMHKGHNWVFRAESFDTMMAWFDDIRILTEKTGEERNAFVRKHARSVSAMSDRQTVSSDGLDEDEADRVPYAADATSLAEQNPIPVKVQRPQPGGRFPSDILLRKTGNMSAAAQDDDDSEDEVAPIATAVGAGAAGGIAAAELASPPSHKYGSTDPYRLEGVTAGTRNDSIASYGFGDRSSSSDFAAAIIAENQLAKQDTNKSYLSNETHANTNESFSPADFLPEGAVAPPVQEASTANRPSEPIVPAIIPAASTSVEEPAVPELPTPSGNAAISAAAAPALEDQATPRAEQGNALAAAGAALPSQGQGERPDAQRFDTTSTISNLHIPGEFPKKV